MSSRYTNTVQHIPEHVFHQVLKHCRGIGEAKGITQYSKCDQGGVESCLPLIALSNTDQVICLTEV